VFCNLYVALETCESCLCYVQYHCAILNVHHWYLNIIIIIIIIIVVVVNIIIVDYRPRGTRSIERPK
jgi:hypothetical protein